MGGAAVVVSTTRLGQSLNEVLTAEPPQRLRQINEGTLSRMGIPLDLIKCFLDNLAFSPRHDTIITVEAGLVLAKAGNGTVLLPFPLDHGVWTGRAERVINELTACYDQATGTKNRYELWVRGTLSPLAKQELQARRIGFAENVDRRIEFMDCP